MQPGHHAPAATGKESVVKSAAIVGGVIGGIVGGAIWAVFGLAGDGGGFWLALIVGGLVGGGMRITGGDAQASRIYPIAAVITLASIALCRVTLLALVLMLAENSDDLHIASIADVYVESDRARGRELDWPADGDPKARFADEDDYPSNIWRRAERKWERLSPREREAAVKYNLSAVDETVITFIADEVVTEWTRKGRTVRWPNEAADFVPMFEPHFPPDVWAEASNRWQDMPEAERSDLRCSLAAELGTPPDPPSTFASSLPEAGRLAFASIGVFDLIWILAAAVVAGRVARCD